MVFKLASAKETRNFHRVLFCVSLLAILFSSTARAALQFDIFPGYDGILPTANWFPIECEVKNDGPSFNAIIEISPDQFAQGQSIRVPIELPTGTLKRVCIPVFSSSHRNSWDARLIDQRGKVRAELSGVQPKKFNALDIPVVGALSRTMAGAPSFPSPRATGPEFRPVAARLQPGIFPDNPLALEGLSMLYVNPEKALDLNVQQVNALIAWLQKGGHLVVGIEQAGDVNGNRWLRDLLPCELKDAATSKSHEALENWLHTEETSVLPTQTKKANPNRPQKYRPGFNPNSSGSNQLTNPFTRLENDVQFDLTDMPTIGVELHQDAKIVIGSEQFPLTIQAARGRGKVTVLLFSPEREPFLSWKNRAWFWTKLANIPTHIFESSDFVRGGYFSSDGVFGAMIDTKQIRKLPLGWLLALLVAYLVVIGPLDQFWLKKINKQMLTWITFPCYVLLFSGLIYFIGFKLRAGDSEWNELSVVDILPNGERAILRGQTYASIYSPNNSWYSLAGDQPFATLRGEFLANYQGETSRGKVEQHGNNFVASVFVPVWTSQLFVNDWMQPSTTAPLKMTVQESEIGWRVTVENKTDRKLSDVHAVIHGRVFDLGVLTPNETKTFSVDSARSLTLQQFTQNNGNRFWEAVQSRQYTFGNNRSGIANIALSSMAASFISQINSTETYYKNFSYPETLDLSRFAAEGRNILLAWDEDHSFTSSLNRFSPRRLHKNTLLRLVQ